MQHRLQLSFAVERRERLRYRFHDLRHAAASALLGAGQDVATVAGVLGHSSPAVTLRVYAHALPNRMREAATAVDALYG